MWLDVNDEGGNILQKHFISPFEYFDTQILSQSLVTIDWGNGLSFVRRQTITWTNAVNKTHPQKPISMSFIVKVHSFSFIKMHSKRRQEMTTISLVTIVLNVFLNRLLSAAVAHDLKILSRP